MATPAHTATRSQGQPVPAARRERLMPIGALMSAMGLAGLVAAGLTLWVLVGLDGWTYYTTPLAVRGYSPTHRLLRPSGPIGQTLGVAGAVLMLVPFFYMAYKRLRRARSGASLKRLLEVHVFCGIVGPVLITFHTAFKFNGLVSAAYWSMVLVAASGFVGRYLYVRIPRTQRGVELSQVELDDRFAALRDELQWSVGPEILAALDRLESDVAGRPLRLGLMGDRALRRTMGGIVEQLERQSGRELSAAVMAALDERVRLRHRRAALAVTKRLFDLWHVFHLPLVWVMFAIVTLHVGVSLYLGYVPFRW